MAAGAPVIVTRGGATEDFCPDTTALKIAADLVASDMGEYLEPRIDSILEQMNHAVQDADLLRRLATTASEWTARRYSWERATQALTDVLLAQERIGPGFFCLHQSRVPAPARRPCATRTLAGIFPISFSLP